MLRYSVRISMASSGSSSSADRSPRVALKEVATASNLDAYDDVPELESDDEFEGAAEDEFVPTAKL